MIFYSFILYLFFVVPFADLTPTEPEDDIVFELLDKESNSNKFKDANSYTIIENTDPKEKVSIKLYYGCLCPFSKRFYIDDFMPVVEKLAPYLSINVNPYGNTETTIKDGILTFDCQHGEEECYGSKLHACALFHLGLNKNAYRFNACLMNSTFKGSDDETADKCGKSMSVDSDVLKSCARIMGSFLLNSFGEESRKIDHNYVPYVLINDVENDGENFFEDVCAAFKDRPAECNEDLPTSSSSSSTLSSSSSSEDE